MTSRDGRVSSPHVSTSGETDFREDAASTAHPDAASATAKPRLLFFLSAADGRSRRIEGYLAQVLQRRRNHDTFVVHKIDVDDRPDLVQRFRIPDGEPALLVVSQRLLRARLDGPRGVKDIAELLGPWLR
jgi:hypothetical protein